MIDLAALAGKTVADVRLLRSHREWGQWTTPTTYEQKFSDDIPYGIVLAFTDGFAITIKADGYEQPCLYMHPGELEA